MYNLFFPPQLELGHQKQFSRGRKQGLITLCASVDFKAKQDPKNIPWKCTKDSVQVPVHISPHPRSWERVQSALQTPKGVCDLPPNVKRPVCRRGKCGSLMPVPCPRLVIGPNSFPLWSYYLSHQRSDCSISVLSTRYFLRKGTDIEVFHYVI